MSHYAGSKVVVVGEQFCVPYAVELEVAQKKASLGSGDFHIKDAQDRIIFKMDSHALSLHDKRVLLDPAGQPILCAHKAKLISTHEKWEASLGEKFDEATKLFQVQKASAMQFKTHLEVFLAGNPSESNPDFTIKGNFFERHAQIFQGDTNVVITEIKRKFTAANVMLDKHTFTVAVWPNVDQAFIATLVVIMDEIQD